MTQEISEGAATAFTPVRLPLSPRFRLGKVPIDRIPMEYAAILLTEYLLHRYPARAITVVGPNAHLVTLAERDSRFAAALQAADVSVPDGISVVMASYLLGVGIPERVTGGDLMERMCAQAAKYRFRVFFLGGLPNAAELAAHHLRERYPGLIICGTHCPPPGFENDPVEQGRIRAAIAAAAPDLLCVAFGAPKQEIWVQENRNELYARVILSVGAALDTHADLRRRAPLWVQRIALEWFFRLMMEPRRLWRRYFFGNPRFVLLVLCQWWRERLLPRLQPRQKPSDPQHPEMDKCCQSRDITKRAARE